MSSHAPRTTPVCRATSRRPVALTGLLVALALPLAACGSDDSTAGTGDRTTSTTADAPKAITVENCGKAETFKAPAQRIVASNPSNIGTLLRIGAKDQLDAVVMRPDEDAVLKELFDIDVSDIPHLDTGVSLEGIVARRPTTVIGPWNSIFSDSRGVTPDKVRGHGADAYVISDSCPQKKGDNKTLGVMDPWEAVRTDIVNQGRITGHEEQAAGALKEFDQRLAALRDAPKPDERPTVFLFDSGTKDVFTSGRFGPPQGIIDAAGGTNPFGRENGAWVRVSWESVTASKPDAVVIMDYGDQALKQKIDILKARPGLKDLPAIKEERFIVLSLAMFTSGFTNIDGAERIRDGLERFGLVPERTDASGTK
ncbi:MAG: ABC transporter substrate-binding protein [Solirubrobacteraceae bacterium]